MDISTFIVGRQILIMACTFLFKMAFDAASLTAAEIASSVSWPMLCPGAWHARQALYGVLDHWVVSVVLCSMLVGYTLQVPAKLMAQNHPMRFFTSFWLASCVPIVASSLGLFSGLARPLAALRKDAAAKHGHTRATFFSGEKEMAPLDARQVTAALAMALGEDVDELTLTLTKPATARGRTEWLLRGRARYVICKPSMAAGHVVCSRQAKAFEFEVTCRENGQIIKCVDKSVRKVQTLVDNANSASNEKRTYLQAQFERTMPEGSVVTWDFRYLTSVARRPDPTTSVKRWMFSVPITKPIKRVVFKVAEGKTCEPEVRALLDDGLAILTCEVSPVPCEEGLRVVQIAYPPVGSRLEIYF